MDDIVLISNDMAEINHVKHILDTKFKIKDLGSLRYFLSLEISRSKSGIHMNQRKYTLEVLDGSGLIGSKHTNTPDPFIKLQANHGQLFSKAAGYWQLVGKLLYLTIIGPDISYVYNNSANFCANLLILITVLLKESFKGSPAQGSAFANSDELAV